MVVTATWWSRRRTVLNARGHRSGDDARSSRTSARNRATCSTPEGIEAATTQRSAPWSRRSRAVLNARGHRSGDDVIALAAGIASRYGCSTPEGIEAATTPRGAQRPLRRGVLNARGHRSGDDSPRRRCGGRWTCCAQRPRASKRRRRSGRCGWRATAPSAQRPRASKRRRRRAGAWLRGHPGRVLNARGHRSGDDSALARSDALVAAPCSTPEGIEAATTTSTPAASRTACGAQRPRASKRRRRRCARCSARPPPVLNARGHRSGDDVDPHPPLVGVVERVLNARGHRSGDDLGGAPRGALALRSAQRPRASKRRRLTAMRIAPGRRPRCSTPEGIEAATTPDQDRP